MPKSPEEVRAEATAKYVEVSLDDAYSIAEEYTTLVARRKANREQLRSLIAQGKLSPEQIEEVNEMYPARTKAEEVAEEAQAA